MTILKGSGCKKNPKSYISYLQAGRRRNCGWREGTTQDPCNSIPQLFLGIQDRLFLCLCGLPSLFSCVFLIPGLQRLRELQTCKNCNNDTVLWESKYIHKWFLRKSSSKLSAQREYRRKPFEKKEICNRNWAALIGKLGDLCLHCGGGGRLQATDEKWRKCCVSFPADFSKGAWMRELLREKLIGKTVCTDVKCRQSSICSLFQTSTKTFCAFSGAVFFDHPSQSRYLSGGGRKFSVHQKSVCAHPASFLCLPVFFFSSGITISVEVFCLLFGSI